MTMEWTGDLDDDCSLERYGMTAHVECMERGWWWFAVGRGEFPNYVELYNTADNATVVRLTTGKMANLARTQKSVLAARLTLVAAAR